MRPPDTHWTAFPHFRSIDRNAVFRLVCSLCFAVMVSHGSDPLFGQEGRGPGFGQGRGQGPGFGRGPGFGQGRGQGRGAGFGRGQGPSAQNPGARDRFAEDHDTLHFLLEHHEKIQRTIEDLADGVRTVTESDAPEVADKIKEHVEWMTVRVKEVNPIRMRDPLFREIFKHAKEIQIKHEDTPKGVVVIETSTNPYVVKLIQEHARVVSKFVKYGHDEAHKNHEVPVGDDEIPPAAGKHDANHSASPPSTGGFPMVIGHGSVVNLPKAAHQPRDGTKICIDFTAKGPAAELHPGLEKASRYLNIYAGAGEHPAEAQFALVIHGDALSVALSDEAYSQKHATKGNPNLDLLKQLRALGVRIYVCGQSLNKAGFDATHVGPSVELAVSALTANINHQLDGFVISSIR